MATKYIVKDLLFAREGSDGNIVSNPSILRVCATEYTIMESRGYTDRDCLLTEGTKEIEGKSTVDGGMKYALDANSIGFTLAHLMGDKTSVSNRATSAWSSETVMAIGDQANTSDGKWTLTVVRVNGNATTGTVEPVPTEKGETITDGNVTFVADNKLVEAVFPIQTNVPKFRAEVTLYDPNTDETWTKQYHNLELDKYPITINGEATYEVSVSTVGGIAVDTDSELWAGKLMDTTGAKLVRGGDDELGVGDCSLTSMLIDNVATELDSIELTIDKGLTVKDGVNCSRRTERKLAIKGKLEKEFTPEDYRSFRARGEFEAKAMIKSKSGASVEWLFPKVVPQFSDANIKTREEVLIDPNINVEAVDQSTPLCTATAVIPSIVDDATGEIIGDGCW